MFKTYSSLYENIREKNSLRVFYLQNQLYKDIPVDIIMPTFNRADSIGASIDSILNQTHANWDLYVWDDGSTDQTKQYFKQFDSNPKIHYCRSEANKGVSFARNRCLDLSKSHIITYLDSDNQWSPDYLQTVCSFMMKSKLECAYLGIKLINENGIKSCLGREFSWKDCHTKNYVDLNCFAHTRNQLKSMKKQWGYGFDESIQRLVDWDFILRMTHGQKCEYLDLFLVDYYCGSNGSRITSSYYTKESELTSLIQYIQGKHQLDLKS